MLKEELVIKAKEVGSIIESKQLKVGAENLDISPYLDRRNSISTVYRANDIEKINIKQFITKMNKNKMCNIVVKDCDSPDAYDDKFKNTALLNFASSKNPGGAFLRGAIAQEETLCYRSNLYSVLSKHMDFYNYNRAHLNKALYTDGVIYSSDICFFRDRELNNCLPYQLNVISSAAPNRKVAIRQQVSSDIISETMSRRIEQILKVAIKHKTEHLILGAFGCGVFHNNPEEVAQEMYRLIVNEGYGMYFKQITFAMHDSRSKNSKVFHGVFGY